MAAVYLSLSPIFYLLCVFLCLLVIFLLTLLYCLEFLLFASFRNRHSFAPTRTALTSR
jgi:hypothetical protein